MVFYRTYRPQKIADLDSSAVRDSLTAILSGDIPHAFLFTGPKGLGKTSTARILAKAVNCTTRQLAKDKKPTVKSQLLNASDVEPCNVCDQCVSITDGTNMDVIEIDAASNRGIDEIRDLKDKIRLAPLSASKKVYIIDEVHMLTTEAFNALLKTLEEPPSHALFILCTTEPHKVPATILSRSFHIAFEEATVPELVRSFKRIAEGEKLEVTDDVLFEVAKVADGGFRDGAKIMEELAMQAAGQPITKELVEKRYKIGSTGQAVSEMTSALSERDTKKSLQLVSQLAAQGIDMKYFMQQLIDTLHDQLLLAAGITDGKSKKKPVMTLVELRELLLLLTRAHADVKYAVLSQIPLELAIIDWCVPGTRNLTEPNSTSPGLRGASAEQSGMHGQRSTAAFSEEKRTITTFPPEKPEVTVKILRKQTGEMQKAKAMYGEPETKEKPIASVTTSHVSLMHYSAGVDTKEWVDHLWLNIISEMKVHNHTLAGVLRGCTLKSYDRKSLSIETPFVFHKDKLSEAKTMQVLEQIIKQLTGNPVKVTIELKKN